MSMLEGILGVILFFGFAVCLLFGLTIMSNFQSHTQQFLGPIANETMTDTVTTLELFDKLFFGMMIFFLIATLIFAFMLESHPAYFFVSLILLIVTVIIAVVFSNIFEQVSEVDALAPSVAEFDIMIFVMDKIPVIIIIMMIVLMVMLYAKIRGGG